MQSDLFAGWWWHANYLIAVFLACSLWGLYAMLEKNGCPPLMLHVDCGPFVLCLLFSDGWVSLWKSRTVPWEGAEKKTCSYTRSVGLLLIVLCYKGCSWLMDHFLLGSPIQTNLAASSAPSCFADLPGPSSQACPFQLPWPRGPLFASRKRTSEWILELRAPYHWLGNFEF